jgi:transketolase
MRKEFAKAVLDLALKDERIVFLTGDLGFMALEELRDAMKERFINCGVAEQNMASMAAGLAAKGFLPFAYSIAPFITLRPYEQLRNDVALHNLPVTIVGNGGGYGYGIMGATHHVLEDICIMRALPNMRVFVPSFSSDVEKCVHAALHRNRPAYLRLGKSVKEFGNITIESPWQACRRVSHGRQVTLITTGPIIENVITLLPDLPENSVDLFSVSEFPLTEFGAELKQSISSTKSVLVIEEHLQVGGLAENLAHMILSQTVPLKTFKSLTAQGYPSGRYGSQLWHQTENELAGASLLEHIKEALQP